MASAASPAPAPRLIGRYLLFSELAAGGMATVHFGRLSGPAGFSRTVAIKRLHPHLAKDPEFVTMFLDEARVAARIRHPNVVPTLDVVATDGEVFLVMEYVQGESLSKLLRAVRSMMTPADARVAATIMAGVLHGLHAAHEAVSEQGEPLGIVHRDVSPQNVLVGVDGVARVLDFGVAKAMGRLQTTREGQIKGKLAYMAPEQLHNHGVTRQTDVFAAAAVTWEALTGQRLFKGESEAAVVTAVLQRPIPPPSAVAPHVPLAVDRVVLRGLERDPARRYLTAREMAIDLERTSGVAPASEVGEWVEGLARDELLRRAARVAEIEASSSVKSSPAIAVVDMPTTVTASTQLPLEPASATDGAPREIRSDVSSIAVSPILSAEPRRQRGRMPLIAGLAAAGGLAVVVVALLVGRGGSSGVTAASVQAAAIAAPPETTAAPDPSSQPSAAATPEPAPQPEPAADSAQPATEAAPPVAVAKPRPTPAPSPTHRRAASPPHHAAAAASDCDPPFWIDDKGHKHYKPACLQ